MKVWKGKKETVSLIVDEDINLLLDIPARRGIRLEYLYKEPIIAPINKGDKLGEVHIIYPNSETIEVPLVAGEEVKKKNAFINVIDVIRHFIFRNGFDCAIEMWREVDKCNWFRPQHEFVSKTTHLWRFEDGFGDNFIKWLLDKFNVELKVGKSWSGMSDRSSKRDIQLKAPYDYIEVPDSVNKYKSCVEEYYKKDFKRFDY